MNFMFDDHGTFRCPLSVRRMMSCATIKRFQSQPENHLSRNLLLQTVESGIVQTDTSQLIAILRQQDAKFQALENQIQGKKKILTKEVFLEIIMKQDPTLLFS